jgi:DNA-binding MarR family transcriptional regulator
MIRRTARHLTREYDRVMKPTGLKLTQYSVLANLIRAGGLSITDLAERLAMDRTTLTRNLRPLEKAGWIVVRPGPDRRSRAVHITDLGRDTYEQAQPLWREAERLFRRSVGQAESAEFRRLLDLVLAGAEG